MNKGVRFFRIILDSSIGRNILTKRRFITTIINERHYRGTTVRLGLLVTKNATSTLVGAVAFFHFMIKLILDPEQNCQDYSGNRCQSAKDSP